MADFEQAIFTFVKGCQELVSGRDKQYENVQFNTQLTYDMKKARRYVRIVKSDDFGATSVYCFVDKTNGNVLKADGWKSPAKHARGNIYDEYNGLRCMGAYGPAYLR